MRDGACVFFGGLAENEVSHLVNVVMVIDVRLDADTVRGLVGVIDD